MKKTVLYLLRHGETDWNLKGRWQGSVDIPLNETGRLQADTVAVKMQSIPIQAIYCSHLERAHKTAEIIGIKKGLTPIPYPEFSERHFGRLEGILHEEARELYRERFAFFDNLSLEEQMHFKIVEDMESPFEVRKRTLPVLENLAQKHLGENILIVTHGSLIKSLIIQETKLPWGSYQLKNCEWITMEYTQAEGFDYERALFALGPSSEELSTS